MNTSILSYFNNSSAIINKVTDMTLWTPYFVIPHRVYFYIYEIWFIHTTSTVLPDEQAKFLANVTSILLKYILLPMFYAYLLRQPTPQVNIHMPNGTQTPVVYGSPSSQEMDLPQVEKDILSHLCNRPTGSTVRMILHNIQESYPEMGMTDVNNRLHILLGKNLVREVEGEVVTAVWVAVNCH